MSFYSLLQKDVHVLKGMIHESQTKKEKFRYIQALFLRSLLLVAFAVVFISLCNVLFGDENSSMAVVLFCVLLSVRFVDFGYQIKHTFISLAIVLFLLLVSPVLMLKVPVMIGFVINFVSLLTILVLTTVEPIMGNSGLYMFGYVFLTGNPVYGHSFLLRMMMCVAGYVVLSLVMYMKHKHKNKEQHIIDVFKRFDLHDDLTLWRIMIALGLSLLFFFGRYFQTERFMWIGFACSSLLSMYPNRVEERVRERVIGIIIGVLLFFVIYQMIPQKMIAIIGPLSGVCLGFCATYRYKTVFNCFGALLMAVTIFGFHEALMIRVVYNVIGLLFGYVFYTIFYKTVKFLKSENYEIN